MAIPKTCGFEAATLRNVKKIMRRVAASSRLLLSGWGWFFQVKHLRDCNPQFESEKPSLLAGY
jgi:hypothetical protein